MSHDDVRDRAIDLLRTHGGAAGPEAAMKADAACERGDDDAQRLWIAVMKLIMEIERIDPQATVQ